MDLNIFAVKVHFYQIQIKAGVDLKSNVSRALLIKDARKTLFEHYVTLTTISINIYSKK